MAKSVVSLLVLLGLICATIASPALYSMQISCLGWLCESVKLDLGTLDSSSGAFNLITNVVAKAEYYDVWNSVRLSSQSSDLSMYYYAIVNYKTNVPTLYSVNVVTKKVTVKKLPTTVMRQTLSSITGGTAGQLFAVYGNIFTTIDLSSGSISKQFNLWTTSTQYNNTGIATFDSTANTVYVDAVDSECEYLFAANVKTGAVVQSPCNDLVTPFSWQLVYLAPYNGAFVSLSTALMGNDLGYFYVNATFGNNFLDFQDFAGINLSPSDYARCNLFDPQAGMFYTIATPFNGNGDTNNYLASFTIPAGNVNAQPMINGNFEGFQRIRNN